MTAPQFVLVVVSAAGLVLVFDQVCVRIHEALRRGRYGFQRIRRREIRLTLQGLFSLPSATPEQRLQGLLDLLAASHRDSVEIQNKYQRHITRLAGSLGIAFAAVAVSVTIAHDSGLFRLLVAVTDLFALGSVLYHFFAAKWSLTAWVRDRLTTELLRQDTFLALLYPSWAHAMSNIDLTGAFLSWTRRIECDVLPASGEDLASAIVAFWRTKRSELAAFGGDVTPLNSFQFYLDRRILRQLAWFRAARERVQQAHSGRARSLTILYTLAIVVASLKVLLVIQFAPDASLIEVLALVLLIITGGAGAMSALYFGQNTRSLIHRYHAQERDIEHWLNTFLAPPGQNISFETLKAGRYVVPQEAILNFEDMMIKELVDWVHISRHDSIELGP